MADFELPFNTKIVARDNSGALDFDELSIEVFSEDEDEVTEVEGGYLDSSSDNDENSAISSHNASILDKNCTYINDKVIPYKKHGNNKQTNNTRSRLQDYSEPAGQCRLLLVSLLDNFCSLYDRNPDKNRRLFSLLCRKLCTMGILKSLDFVDDDSQKARAVYKEAFKSIVLNAVKDINSDFAEDKAAQAHPDSVTAGPPSALFTNFLKEDNVLAVPSSGPYSSDEIFLSGRSRYLEDFAEGIALGRGGYGKVVIATNRLDGFRYAIKKINFSGVASLRFTRILREVKSLARLDHANIVRYYSAWIEDHSVLSEVEAESTKSRSNLANSEVSKNVPSSQDHDEFSIVNQHNNSLFLSDLEEDVTDTDVSTIPADSSLSIEMNTISYSQPSFDHQRKRSLPSIAFVHNQQSHQQEQHRRSKSDPYSAVQQSQIMKHYQLQDRKVMYIQMELCRFTLDHYIRQRNHYFFECESVLKANPLMSLKDFKPLIVQDRLHRVVSFPAEHILAMKRNSQSPLPKLSLNTIEIDRVFRHIVCGLHYIHEHGMIHRDLKPMNIFMQAEDDKDVLTAKIGDFGLVSDINSRNPNNSGSSHSSNSDNDESFVSLPKSKSSTSKVSLFNQSNGSSLHTKGVGTVTYASPEQLLQHDYTQRSDIYSLGIVAFELYYPMQTQMERTRVLADLKNHHRFPESFLRYQPKEAALIWACIARDPQMRPLTGEILESSELMMTTASNCTLLPSSMTSSRCQSPQMSMNSAHSSPADAVPNRSYSLDALRTENDHLRALLQAKSNESASYLEQLEKLKQKLRNLQMSQEE